MSLDLPLNKRMWKIKTRPLCLRVAGLSWAVSCKPQAKSRWAFRPPGPLRASLGGWTRAELHHGLILQYASVCTISHAVRTSGQATACYCLHFCIRRMARKLYFNPLIFYTELKRYSVFHRNLSDVLCTVSTYVS